MCCINCAVAAGSTLEVHPTNKAPNPSSASNGMLSALWAVSGAEPSSIQKLICCFHCVTRKRSNTHEVWTMRIGKHWQGALCIVREQYLKTQTTYPHNISYILIMESRSLPSSRLLRRLLRWLWANQQEFGMLKPLQGYTLFFNYLPSTIMLCLFGQKNFTFET